MIASRAGKALLALRDSRPSDDRHAAEFRAEADRLANDIIFELLKPRIAEGDGFLSEEHPDDEERLEHQRVWIVDPLDGTREFAEPARTDWAVHIGLAVDSVAAAGAVALPAQGAVVYTGDPPKIGKRMSSRVKVAVSRTRPPGIASWLVERLGCEMIAMGSAGAKAMAVVRGEADAYIHAGGQYEWDSCAPVAVALAVGLHASRLDGSLLRYNQTDPYLPDLVICRPELRESIAAAVVSYSDD